MVESYEGKFGLDMTETQNA